MSPESSVVAVYDLAKALRKCDMDLAFEKAALNSLRVQSLSRRDGRCRVAEEN